MPERYSQFWMIAVLLGFTWLVGTHLDIDPIWYDESRTFYYAGWETETSISITETVTRVSNSDVQAPAYYVLLNGWGALLGRTAFSARLFSLYAGVLALSVAYQLGRTLASSIAGLSAAILLGASAFFIIYAHEARTYAMLVLFIGLALLAYWRLMHGGREMWYVVLLFSMAVLPYSHYLAALIFPAIGFYHLLNYQAERRWWTISGGIVLAGVLFLPWVMLAFQAAAARATFERSPVPTLSFPQILTTIITEFSNGYTALLLLLLAMGIRWRNRANRFVWITGAVMLLSVYIFDQLVPLLNHSRYLIVMWVFIALIAGMGVERLSQMGVPLVLLLVIWAGVGIVRGVDDNYRLNVNGPGSYGAWDFAAQFLEHRAQNGDLALVHLPANTRYDPFHKPVADYYLRPLNVDTAGVESRRLQPDTDYIDIGLERARGEDRIWYIRDLQQIPERYGLFDTAMSETFAHCGEVYSDAQHRVDFYIEPPQPDEVTMRFGEGIELVPYVDFERNIPDMLYMASGWLVDNHVPPHTYSVALHMVDADGTIVLQADYPLPESGAHCGYGMFDLSALPAGEYEMLVSVYAWQTGERLSGEIADSGEPLERLPLGVIAIGE